LEESHKTYSKVNDRVGLVNNWQEVHGKIFKKL